MKNHFDRAIAGTEERAITLDKKKIKDFEIKENELKAIYSDGTIVTVDMPETKTKDDPQTEQKKANRNGYLKINWENYPEDRTPI